MEHGTCLLFWGEVGGNLSRALCGERCGFFWAGGGDEALGRGFVLYGAGWKGRAGGAGRRGYGHWLVRVPPELVLGVGEVRVPPLPMEGVGLPACHPILLGRSG
jgi:hypothetical protein